MSEFRRRPDWEQHADRHTTLIDPVLTVHQLGGLLGGGSFRRLQTRIVHALVFSTSKGGYVAYPPPQRPGSTRGYTAVYEVDMGVHPLTAELRLPSDNDAYEFEAVLDIAWQVVDPALFVSSQHRDVPRLLLGELERAARPVARGFAIADSAAAESELLSALPPSGSLGRVAGISAAWSISLRRDQDNIEHQRRMQAIAHASREGTYAEQVAMEYDAQLDQRVRAQDTLAAGRALAYGVQQHELAIQTSRQQAELQRVDAEKIEFYAWHLQQGGVHQWALHLAQHPEDSQLVIRTMREDQLQKIRDEMDLVARVLGGTDARSHEMEEPKRLALSYLKDMLNQRLPGVPQDPRQQPGLPPGDTPLPGPAGQQPGPHVPPPAFPGWQPPAGYGQAPMAPEPEPADEDPGSPR
ncbi:hypothetical protein ACFXDJ_30360 [Streptomyces sp. NPDC059443]|uniref:hypothetical protein n=1 Tax=unclassified Streptomyces TaxID=2593676 RepID=UPI0036BA4A51